MKKDKESLMTGECCGRADHGGEPVTLYREIVTSADKQLRVDILDEKGSGGANHLYRISGFSTRTNPGWPGSIVGQVSYILFQNGPIDVDGNGLNGVTHEVLLDIICHRLECFQAGPYACRENALALTKLQEARHWLAHRTRAREARGVEGTHEI